MVEKRSTRFAESGRDRKTMSKRELKTEEGERRKRKRSRKCQGERETRLMVKYKRGRKIKDTMQLAERGEWWTVLKKEMRRNRSETVNWGGRERKVEEEQDDEIEETQEETFWRCRVGELHAIAPGPGGATLRSSNRKPSCIGASTICCCGSYR